MSWEKVTGSFIIAWIGYEINLREYSLGISARRAEWVTGWLKRNLSDNRVLLRELRQALGREVCIYGALSWDTPFLAPLFSFLSHGGPGACLELPLFVRTIMGWLLARIQQRRVEKAAGIGFLCRREIRRASHRDRRLAASTGRDGRNLHRKIKVFLPGA